MDNNNGSCVVIVPDFFGLDALQLFYNRKGDFVRMVLIKGKKGLGMLLGVILMVMVVAVLVYGGIKMYGLLVDDADEIITIDDKDPTIWEDTQAQNRKEALNEFYRFVEELKKVAQADSVSGDSNLCFGTFSDMPTLLGKGFRIKIEKKSNGMSLSLLQWIYDPTRTGSQKSVSDWQILVDNVPINGFSPCVVGGKKDVDTSMYFLSEIIRGDEYKKTTHTTIGHVGAFGRIVDRIDFEDKNKIILWVDYDDQGNKIPLEERSFELNDMRSFTNEKGSNYHLVFKYNDALCFVPTYYNGDYAELTKRCEGIPITDGFLSVSCLKYYDPKTQGDRKTVPNILIEDPDKKGMICEGFQANYASIK